MKLNETIKSILERKSVRRYTDEPVGEETLSTLVEAARWAPSGLNNQPWRFVTIESREKLDEVAGFTKYAKILNNSTAAIGVFLDTSTIYHREKDIQSIGAAIENILIAAEALGVGACWLGEILNRREEVEKALEVAPTLELMAVIALGHPPETDEGSNAARKGRLPSETLIVGKF